MPEQANLFEESTQAEESQKEEQKAQLTQQQLESHLWEAANILRGSIDSGDYKHYIFGLLFYKRLCDVWNEEYEELIEEFDGDTEMAVDPEEHRFHIPFGCMWAEDLRPDPKAEEWPTNDKGNKIPKTIREWSKDIGTALNMAFRQIEDSNPRLKGVFQDVDFANKERFPDTMLEQLLQHFEKHRMRKADVDSNILGNAYEYLIAKFADDAGKKGGEFYTPKEVVRLMVEILRPEEGQTLYDPTCGSGGMLLEAVHNMTKRKKDPSRLTLYGQEKNLNTWAICKMSLFLHDIDDAFIERGDTLLEPKHKASDTTLKRFDYVLANPPFSLKSWGHKVWSGKAGDPYNRAIYGVPPKSYGDLAFVQHMIASLSKTGKMAVVVPHGVLFRSGAEGKIRTGILKDDLVEAVVGLGANLFYGTGIPAAIIYINRNKAKERKNKVLIVNAEKETVSGTNQNKLSLENIEKIMRTVRDYSNIELFSRVVKVEEIAENDYNLNLPRYVQTTPPPPPIDTNKEIALLEGLISKSREADIFMFKQLKGLGYGK